jgi:hypothetical protein
MFRSREDSTASRRLTVPPLDEVGEDTTAFSVATLRDLVARSAQDPPATPAVPETPKAPKAPSVPAFLEKGGAVLVMPESGPRLIAAPAEAPAVAPPEAPAVAPPETPFVAQHEAVAVAVAAAPATSPAAFVTTHIRRKERTRPRAVRAVVSRRSPSVWAFLRCRLYFLGLLALVVASQPWWWNVCDMRAPRSAAAAPGPTVAP